MTLPLTEETVNSCTIYKKFTCGVCGNDFSDYVIRTQKLRFQGTDDDLHANYEPVDPLLYDCVVCPFCGYSAIVSYFNRIGEKQKQALKAGVMAKYKPHEFAKVMTLESALVKYKLALVTAAVKGARASETGYICARIAWLSRMAENKEAYAEFAAKAVSEFEAAFEKEDFPICNMDEPTFGYLLAVFKLVEGKRDECLRWLGRVITDRSASDRVKQKAADLKASLK